MLWPATPSCVLAACMPVSAMDIVEAMAPV
jgi:hypothetical protein